MKFRADLSLLCCITIFFLAVSMNLRAQDRPVKVGTKVTPPFAFKDAEGNWTGISVDLWQSIMAELEMQYEFEEMELQELLDSVRDRQLDAAVAAFTITADREAYLDFAHPYFVTGLSIAVSTEGERNLLTYVRRILSVDLLKVILLLAGLLFVVGALVWVFERRRNPEQFGGGRLQGLVSGFWWSAVTMTTVGYGDKAPGTLGGRLVALFWMFAGIIIISSFTAAITTQLTVSQLEGVVNGPDDLPKARVATVGGSTSAAYLSDRGIRFRSYQDVDECLQVLAAGRVDCVVYDEPILRYTVKEEFQDRLQVIPGTFDAQYYGIILPQRSTLREEINRVLLELIADPAWQQVKEKYFGS